MEAAGAGCCLPAALRSVRRLAPGYCQVRIARRARLGPSASRGPRRAIRAVGGLRAMLRWLAGARERRALELARRTAVGGDPWSGGMRDPAVPE